MKSYENSAIAHGMQEATGSNPVFSTSPPLYLYKGGFLFFASLIASKFDLADRPENMRGPFMYQ